MSQIASAGPLADALSEYLYVSGQLFGLIAEGMSDFFLALVKSLRLGLKKAGTDLGVHTARRKVDHVHAHGQQVLRKVPHRIYFNRFEFYRLNRRVLSHDS